MPARYQLEGSPIAYAAAGLAVAIGFAIGVAASTEPPRSREEGARLAYAECLAEGRSRDSCAPRREVAVALCVSSRDAAACERALAAAEAAPAAAAVEERGRVAGPLRASPRRAAIGAPLALLVLAAVVALRRPGAARVTRVGAGAAVGLALASIPAFGAAALGILVAAILPESEIALVGFGLFVATFAAVVGMPAAAGAADPVRERHGARVHASLLLVSAGTAAWTILVGPIPSPGTVWLQAIASHALALAGYFVRRPGL
jgi:hypothetical protein